MALLRKLLDALSSKANLALAGAILIHITLGTVYTLSNVNSYATSYMRLHGTPAATYGGSMWISSSYAVGQGVFMVLGGYLERRFSARLACLLGCLLHSGSIAATSWSIKQGQLAVLLTYGLLPGLGAGLAYMTPMSNSFKWTPDRKGLVVGLILAGFGLGTFIFNVAQTSYVNPQNLSPPPGAKGYFTQKEILDRVPGMFLLMGASYASLQLLGCSLLFKPPPPAPGQQAPEQQLAQTNSAEDCEQEPNGSRLDRMPFKRALMSREFIVLFIVYGVTNQGVLFVNAMLKEYAQLFITDDLFLAWTGSAASLANSLGRLGWGLAIDRFTFTQCLTISTLLFASLMFLMPFKFILASKWLYLACTLAIFGSFSSWKSTYPVHLSRVFGVHHSGMIYGLIYTSQVSTSFLPLCSHFFPARRTV